MIDQRLLTYIEQELKRGVPSAAIKNVLRDVGWADEVIDQAFAVVQNQIIPPSPNQAISKATTEENSEILPQIKKISTAKAGDKNKKLSLVLIIGLTIAILIILTGSWYFIFIVQNKQTPIADETIPNILKKQDLNPQVLNQPIEMAENGNNNAMTATTSLEQITNDSLISNPIISKSTNDNATGTLASVGGDMANDNKRKEDLDKLAAAQKLWFAEHKSYYTCNLTAGDCGGRPYGLPDQIGIYLNNVNQDPLAGNYANKKAVCGKDYVYCGLNNVLYPNFFCYYAKLESGGYYTVSQTGSAIRQSAPKFLNNVAFRNKMK